MGSWIQEHHKWVNILDVCLTNSGDSGIIYCLSKKDAETVADELRSWSNGELKVRIIGVKSVAEEQTGVYHAGVDEYAKEKIHTDWRKGRVKFVQSLA